VVGVPADQVHYPLSNDNPLVKLDIGDEDIPDKFARGSITRPTWRPRNRPDERYLALAEELKRKKPNAEVAKPEESAKRRA
jgi:hypothetical protein